MADKLSQQAIENIKSAGNVDLKPAPTKQDLLRASQSQAPEKK